MMLPDLYDEEAAFRRFEDDGGPPRDEEATPQTELKEGDDESMNALPKT